MVDLYLRHSSGDAAIRPAKLLTNNNWMHGQGGLSARLLLLLSCTALQEVAAAFDACVAAVHAAAPHAVLHTAA
jgi:hypothetical protein